MNRPRRLAWDWYDGEIPANCAVDETAYIETTFSFNLYRSQLDPGVTIGRGASTYLGTMFDVGERGRVKLGNYVLCHGARIICDESVEIGDYSLISWNVVVMDTYRVSNDVLDRRRALESVSGEWPRHLSSQTAPRPVRIGRNTWIGFDACIMPGVTIGEGSVVGARSVVKGDVEPYSVVAGNPARTIRRIQPEKPLRPM